ncbi:phage baseplate plug family protein [Leptospira santarosai]|uniref:phage baseplate plug family protein n=1 Tax=Leptospira santarosai TaxID=28183 RepID=UPI000BB9D128|nr:hypothetical protein [Leptospira santarosai]ASV10738.1 hypothetical protein B2G51_01890 [Leptospira santarosai]MBW9231036.1 hypothetical protein [Leptospira santarosai]MDI7172138.1 hypothetical protein [Leptospira santarosai]MDI7191699.1 hypothetical protein [Leptospira santarosai]MDI7230110.1 hypothetical protein [Leptospira santarosai]
MIRSLPITFEELPVSKTFQIESADYEFEFRYNSRFDFISIYVKEGFKILHTARLVYGNDCMQGFANFSLVPLSPNDLSNEGYRNLLVNGDTFGKSVFLYFDDGEN